MSGNKKSILIKYLVCFCIAVALVFVILLIQGFFKDTVKANMHVLHNAFFATGALMMLFSGLLFVTDEGAFLGVGYAFGRLVKTLLPFWGKDHETYAEYRERKESKKKTSTVKLSLLLTGLVFFLISLIFLVIWHNV
ncbi:MAG: DUF3899 domain-containing protein [Clostridia bacterium]|nr:DUF3899 domain-containing protein [Clostridia bacterium]